MWGKRTSCFLLLGTALAGGSQGVVAGPPAVEPFLTCVEPLAGDPATQFYAYFGYESREAAVVQIAIGSDNRFMPGPAGRGQPDLFLPGLNQAAFRVMLDASTTHQWVLLGVPVSASVDMPRCVEAERVPLYPAPVDVPGGGPQAAFGMPQVQVEVFQVSSDSLQVPAMVSRATTTKDRPARDPGPGNVDRLSDIAGESRAAPATKVVAGRNRLR